MIKYHTPPKISVEEARIHAHLCADGYLYVSKEREEGRWRKRYHIRYSNTQEILRKEFANDVLNAYNRKAVQCQKNEIEIKSKLIFQRLSELGVGGSRDWFIGREITTSQKTIKAAWLKAFFDDEGTVELPNPPKDYHKRLTVKSVNMKGLKQTKNLLKDFSIISNIRKNSDKTYYLRIDKKSSILKYEQLIGFNHPEKARLMNLMAKILHAPGAILSQKVDVIGDWNADDRKNSIAHRARGLPVLLRLRRRHRTSQGAAR